MISHTISSLKYHGMISPQCIDKFSQLSFPVYIDRANYSSSANKSTYSATLQANTPANEAIYITVSQPFVEYYYIIVLLI